MTMDAANSVTPGAVALILANPSPDSAADVPEIVLQVVDLKPIGTRFTLHRSSTLPAASHEEEIIPTASGGTSSRVNFLLNQLTMLLDCALCPDNEAADFTYDQVQVCSIQLRKAEVWWKERPSCQWI